jgi:hypothetical protein
MPFTRSVTMPWCPDNVDVASRHQPIVEQDRLDPNNYVVGRFREHSVVIACLPAGVYGTNTAASVSNDMRRTFTGLLGDVVVSQPDRTVGGVVQSDLRENLGDGRYERKGFLKPAPTLLLNALSTLQAEHDLEDSEIPVILANPLKVYPTLMKNGHGFPGRETSPFFAHNVTRLARWAGATYAWVARS